MRNVGQKESVSAKHTQPEELKGGWQSRVSACAASYDSSGWRPADSSIDRARTAPPCQGPTPELTKWHFTFPFRYFLVQNFESHICTFKNTVEKKQFWKTSPQAKRHQKMNITDYLDKVVDHKASLAAGERLLSTVQSQFDKQLDSGLLWGNGQEIQQNPSLGNDRPNSWQKNCQCFLIFSWETKQHSTGTRTVSELISREVDTPQFTSSSCWLRSCSCPSRVPSPPSPPPPATQEIWSGHLICILHLFKLLLLQRRHPVSSVFALSPDIKSLFLVSNNLNLIYMLHLWRPMLVDCPSWDWLGMLLLASWFRKFQMTLFCSWITWSCCRISEISSFRAWSIPAKNFRKPSDSMVLFLGTDEDNWIFQCLATVFLHPFLAVQNSSIGDLVPWLVGWSGTTNNQRVQNTTEWP